jgi:hypothetical protein
VELHVANARFSENRAQRALVAAGRLHGDKRRAGSRNPSRQSFRDVGDPFDMPRPGPANVDPTLRNIHPDKNFAAIALHRAPGQSEISSIGRRAGLHTGVKAQTTVRASDRDAGGSETATVFQDQPTVGAPAGVPIPTRMGATPCNPLGTAVRGHGAASDATGARLSSPTRSELPPMNADPPSGPATKAQAHAGEPDTESKDSRQQRNSLSSSRTFHDDGRAGAASS